LELQPNRKESKQTTTKHFNPFGWKIEEKNKPKSSLNYIKKKKKKKKPCSPKHPFGWSFSKRRKIKPRISS
jgi:hypothetical protein